jgi:outer membrane protein OmpA-like peptidoglycan-associated protein
MNDKCPGHKGTLKYFGCPVPDTDGDGINDDDDKCITIAGIAANNGCPAYADTVAVDKDTIRYIVYFEPGKSILRSEAYNTLSIVIKQLKENPKLVATFTGHTDNVGSVEANYKRSLGRATVCADHVASYYITKNRLMIISVGNKMPAADLTDPLLQWKNRRVEIALFERKE